MDIYKQISEYYDGIFPIDTKTLNFIKQSAGDTPKVVLDIACGSGAYAIEMSKSGYDVTASDNDSQMVLYAGKKAHENDVEVDIVECDMRNVGSKIHKKFDCIYCIGNSIVHVTAIDDITDVFMQMDKLLIRGGTLVIQILNYDRIINLNIKELPVINDEDKGITFIRRYEWDDSSELIKFNTKLIVNNDQINTTIKGTVDLYPLRKDGMLRALKKAGFENVELYGDFSGAPFNEASTMMVIKAIKS